MKYPDPPIFPTDDAETDLLRLVEWQVSFGPRYPGSAAHRLFREALEAELGRFSDEIVVQPFTVPLRGERAECANICALFRGDGKKEPLLVGSHFDTRIIGDNEREEAKRGLPIPGANDGGSGTAILLHLAPMLRELSREHRLSRDVQLVLFDAEDVGNLDGNPFAAGAEAWAANLPAEKPGEVIALDMVGGKGMVLDVDAHVTRYHASLAITRSLFSIGAARGYASFGMEKEHPYKYIISDHAPFMTRGIPACILIDIDYPQWHTQDDLPEHVSGASLAQVEDVVLSYLLLA